MRVCREDDPIQKSRRRELRAYTDYTNQNDPYPQQQQQLQYTQPTNYYTQYPQQYQPQQYDQYSTSPR